MIGGQLIRESRFKLPEGIYSNLRQKVFLVSKVFIE
jgi:hypothetical protein